MDNNLLNNLKAGLILKLEKSGSSIEEFETLLGEKNTEALADKLAGILGDVAGAGEKILGVGGKVLTEAPQMALAMSLLMGSLGGGTLYGIDKHLQGQDQRLGDKQKSIGKMQNITDKLKSDYNING
jgi:hypothetical protein